MKKILIPLVILLLAGGSYYLYTQWNKVRGADIWSYVPENALAVYETNNAVGVWNNFLNSNIQGNLGDFSFWEEFSNHVELLDSVSGREGNLDKIFKDNPFLVSVHGTEKDAIGFTIYIELNSVERHQIAKAIFEKFHSETTLVSSKRIYNDLQIHQIKETSSGRLFSYIRHGDFLIGSFTPFLVEDVIRKIGQGEEGNLQVINNRFAKISKVVADEGNLYVNTNRLPQLISIFSNNKSTSQMPLAKAFAEATFLDIEVRKSNLLLNGFTLANEKSGYLSTLSGQSPVALNVKKYLPNRTAMLLHLTMSDANRWFTALQVYFEKNDPQQITAWNELAEKHNAKVSDLYGWLGNEVALATLESIDEDKPEKLLFAHAADITEGFKYLNNLSDSVMMGTGDTVFYENYGDHRIKQLNIEEFPATVFGDYFEGFQQCFFIPLENYIVFSSSIQGMKSLLRDIDSELTWGKSVKQNQYLDILDDQANFNLFINTVRYWNLLNADLSPYWQDVFVSNASKIQKFDKLAVQFSNVGDKFYTDIVLNYEEKPVVRREERQFNVLQASKLEAPAISKPMTVRNHRNNSREIVVQDSLYNLYLISSAGKILWKDSIGAALEGSVNQIDFYNNGKLQYLFATRSAIHILDRNGKALEGYPMALPNGISSTFTTVVDYDNSKNYRFMVADDNGDIYLFNKEKKNLDGWNPRRQTGRLAMAPWHIRVRGKDCMIAVQRDGKVNIMNRRGQMYYGFPLDLKTSLSGDIYAEIGPNFKQTIFHAMSKGGEIIKFNLEGKILSRKQLDKPSREASFRLCEDVLGKTFVIARQEVNRISILDRGGELIFEKDYIAPEEMKVQYYHFGSGKEIFAITDQTQEFTYLYDRAGQLVNYRPLESGYEIGLLYSEDKNQFRVYKSYGNEVSLISFVP